MTSRVEPLPGSLGFRQVTEGTGWRLTKTWITDPARATVLARVRFESLTGKPLQALRAGRSGAGRRRQRRPRDQPGHAARRLRRRRPRARSRRRRRSSRRRAATAARASDPWQRPRGRRAPERATTRPRRATSSRARARALTGQRGKQDDDARDRLRRERRGGPRDRGRALARGRVRRRRDRVTTPAGRATSTRSKDAPASVAGDAQLGGSTSSRCSCSPPPRTSTYRGASIAAPNMPWIWGTLTLEAERRFSGPYHLVWPRDLYHVATAQKAAGDDDGGRPPARLPLDGAEARTAPGGRTRASTARRSGRPSSSTRSSLPIVLAWWLGRTGATDWAHVEKAADYIVANGPAQRPGALGEPGRLVAQHDRDRDRGPDLRRRHRARERRAGQGGRSTRRSPTTGRQSVESWTATHERPVLAASRTTCA